YVCEDLNDNGICDDEEVPYVCEDLNDNGICDDEEVPYVCEDLNDNGICDDEEVDDDDDETLTTDSDYDTDSLYVTSVEVVNSNVLSSGFDVSSLDIEATGVYYIVDDYLYSEALDNEILVYIELYNQNSYDMENLIVTFVFNGKRYLAEFEDLDDGEKVGQYFSIPISSGLKSGKYSLEISIDNEDVHIEEGFTLDIVSLADVINYVGEDNGSVDEPVVKSLWERILDFLRNLFSF
ncbi:MAG: hypothetical protein Q8Q35_01005, partial [Nanoarchaeota archaeon]|nr:hypothetical protein [Nanoarchaeota archaeon]